MNSVCIGDLQCFAVRIVYKKSIAVTPVECGNVFSAVDKLKSLLEFAAFVGFKTLHRKIIVRLMLISRDEPEQGIAAVPAFSRKAYINAVSIGNRYFFSRFFDKIICGFHFSAGG